MKVTRESIIAKITSINYLSASNGRTTICEMGFQNGWTSIGTSSVAVLAEFNPDLGKALAYDHALEQMFPLEGYLLRERAAAVNPLEPTPGPFPPISAEWGSKPSRLAAWSVEDLRNMVNLMVSGGIAHHVVDSFGVRTVYPIDEIRAEMDSRHVHERHPLHAKVGSVTGPAI